MVFHIAVTDDIPADAQKLAGDIRRIFSNYPQHHVSIQVFDSAESMLSFGAGSFQMVFLDILMDGMNGIELAKKLRAADINMLIVFLTSSPEYAFEAFPVHPFDYLVKPYPDEDLQRVLSEAVRALPLEETVFPIRAAYTSYQVPAASIVSAVAQGHSVELNMEDGQTIRSIMTVAEIRTLLLTEPRFLESNRGVIVNMDHVASLEKGVLHLSDRSVFSLRTRNRGELISQFTQYQISRLKRG